VIKNRTELYYSQADVKTADLYKDLYKLTVAFFKDAKYGLYFTIGYVLAMLALSFHLWHGFQSAFQTIGVNSSKLTPVIKFFGKAFAIIVPLLFAIIPLILHFKK
jgi:succinate dehydrogenase / fumarate reductase cytochrome b subunit